MSNEITMPKLSDTMEEGKIIRWLKHPGDRVKRGDAIAEVETDKADMVLESFDEGVLSELLLKEGDSAAVGAVIARLNVGEATTVNGEQKIAEKKSAQAKPFEPQPAQESKASEARKPLPSAAGDGSSAPRPTPLRRLQRVEHRAKAGGGEDRTAGLAPEHSYLEEASQAMESYPGARIHPSSAAPTAVPQPPEHREKPAQPQPAEDGEAHKLRASPLARRAAEEAGIDLSTLRGTGPDGRITKRDIDNYQREQQMFKFRRLVHPREGEPGTREELSKMRKSIAHRMAQSKREIPHFYVTLEIDMEEASRLKKSIETAELFDVDITYNDMIIKACALSLARFPRVNASYEDDGIVIHPSINVGFALAIEDGLLLPVVKGCEAMVLADIARAAHRLVEKAGHGPFTPDELSGATFSISNMGMVGVEHFAAVIVPPQAAIVAVSSVKDRPVVRNGQLAIGKTMMVTGSFDHRIIDGIVGARFLNEVKRFLENPASLLLS